MNLPTPDPNEVAVLGHLTRCADLVLEAFYAAAEALGEQGSKALESEIEELQARLIHAHRLAIKILGMQSRAEFLPLSGKAGEP